MPNVPGSPDLNSILKKEIKFSFPKIHPLMKKFIAGYLTIFTMLVATLVGLNLMDQNQDIRRRASTTNVDLSLAAPDSVSQNQQFSVNVIITQTNNRPVSAADIRLNYPSALVSLDSISKPQTSNYFATTNMQRPAPTNTRGWDNYSMELYKDTATTGVGRYATGALCDYCYIGSSSSTYPEIQACGTITPTCYPKSAITANQTTLATYNFTVLPNAIGSIDLNLSGTEVAATNSDTNVAGDLIGKTISIAADVPTPTPTGTQSPACAADINQSGRVDLTDYTILKSDFFKTTGFNNPRSDINQSGRVDLTDYTLLKASFFQTCP